jgi:hypothetical protein
LVQEETYKQRAAELVANASDSDLSVEGGKIKQEHLEALWSKNGLHLSKDQADWAFRYIDTDNKEYLDNDDVESIKTNFKTRYKVVKVTTLSESILVDPGADRGDLMVIDTLVEGLGDPEEEPSGGVRVYVKFRNKNGWAEHTTSDGEQVLELISDKSSYLKGIDDKFREWEWELMGYTRRPSRQMEVDTVAKRHHEDSGDRNAKSRRLTDESWKAAEGFVDTKQARIRKWGTTVFFAGDAVYDPNTKISKDTIRRFFESYHNLHVEDVVFEWGKINPWGCITFKIPSKLVLDRFSLPDDVVGIHPDVFGIFVELSGYLPKLHIEEMGTPITEELKPKLELQFEKFGEVKKLYVFERKNGRPSFASVTFSSLTDEEGLAEVITRGHLKIDDASVQITERELTQRQ